MIEMKRFFLFFVALSVILVHSCTKEPDIVKDLVTVSFDASVSHPTKVEIGESIPGGYKVLWSAGDAISVFSDDPSRTSGYTNGSRFSTDIKTASSHAIFTGETDESDIYYAVYPYKPKHRWYYEDDCFSVVFDVEQTADGLNKGIAVAQAENGYLEFKHMTGFIKFEIPSDYSCLKKVSIKGNADEVIGGKYVTIYPGDQLAHEIAAYNASTELSLLPSEDVFEPGVYFLAAMPAKLSSGITMTFVNSDDEIATRKSSASLEIKAGDIVDLGTVANLDFGTEDKPQYEVAELSFSSKNQRTSISATKQIWEQNGIRMINEKGGSGSDVADYVKPVRCYSGSKLTIEMIAGQKMTEIEFSCNKEEYATTLKKSITGGTSSVSGKVVTVSMPGNESFVIEKLSAQVRINSLTVTYEGSGQSSGGDVEDDSPEEDIPDSDGPDGMDPAVNEKWLELPSGAEGSQYVINTLYASGERNYTHLYDKTMFTSLWTAYPLNSSHTGSLKRPGSWSYNPLIDTEYQADLCSGSYSGGTYSRGHMIPNGSRNGIKAMQLQTFHVTNSVPQRQNKFNGTIWATLEQAVRSEASSETIYVVTGVSFNKSGKTENISYVSPSKNSSQKCPIPNYFYKLVLKINGSETAVKSACAVGFWFEHKDYDDNEYADYAVSVDQIEEWTGFDFFVNLPDSVETVAETNSSWDTFTDF